MTANSMIGVDTSSFVSYLQNDVNDHTEALRYYLKRGEAWFPPVVITELLTAPKLKPADIALIFALPVLEIDDGYWRRAGDNRRKLLQKAHKARVADSLIAQSCLDHGIALMALDKDFQPFVKYCGLKLVKS